MRLEVRPKDLYRQLGLKSWASLTFLDNLLEFAAEPIEFATAFRALEDAKRTRVQFDTRLRSKTEWAPRDVKSARDIIAGRNLVNPYTNNKRKGRATSVLEDSQGEAKRRSKVRD